MRRSVQQRSSPLDGLTSFNPAYVGAVVVLLALVGMGAYFVVFRQWTQGLAVTGMNNRVSWGLEIVNFVYFVGLSAGGIIIAAMAHLLGMKEFKPIARFAELLAIACIILALFFILISVGRPDRLLNLFIHGNWTSPLVWDVTIITAYLALAMAMGYFGTRRDLVKCLETIPRRHRLYKLLTLGYTDTSEAALKRDDRILKVLSFVAIPSAVALHSLTAWILGLVKAKALWHSTLLAPLFVVSALVSGLALLIVALVVMRALKVEVRKDTVLKLGKLLLLLIPLLGYFLFAELFTVMYPGVPKEARLFADMMLGKFVVVFWFNLLVGLVAPIVILLYIWLAPARAPATAAVPKRSFAFQAGTLVIAALAIAAVAYSFQLGRTVTTAVVPGAFSLSIAGRAIGVNFAAAALLVLLATRLPVVAGVGLASALVVLGVLAERFNVVVVPFLFPFLPYPPAVYVPTVEEVLSVIGVYALGILGFLVLAKVFPLVEPGDHHAEGS
ncbi:MAG: polysulfide reductase NrfD [Chloroflexi bacterium]|nr:polysulfide reductase NrfD [Chloroflexota bacterium]